MEISERKQKLIDEFVNSPLVVGEEVYFDKKFITTFTSEHGKNELGNIVSIDGDNITIGYDKYGRGVQTVTINKSDISNRRGILGVGSNPFVEKGGRIRTVNYSFDSIIYTFQLVEPRRKEDYIFDGVKCYETNWNPFVYDKDGNKQYYQRPLCWSLEDKQNLIDSIYNGISLGVVLVRQRAWNEIEKMRKMGETDLAFKDIIDGKQRLTTIKEFLHDEFPDSYGNYYSDLSTLSQNKFTNHQLIQYAEMPEWSSDEDVLYQFLKLNFAGVPQSKEHIEHVKSLLTKI